jgi:hypothetical protein
LTTFPIKQNSKIAGVKYVFAKSNLLLKIKLKKKLKLNKLNPKKMNLKKKKKKKNNLLKMQWLNKKTL